MSAGKEQPPPLPTSSNNSGMRSRSVSGRQTPISTADSDDNQDDRMSVSSCSNANTRRVNRLSDFEKECSLEQSPSSYSSEYKTDLSLIPVISDQLLRSWSDGETSFDKADVGLLGKKALDLLCLKNAAEARADELHHRVLSLEATNRRMRETNVKMQARVEQEEEYISNMLLKRIQKLKSDKESIALKYEEEEEHLTNDLTRKLSQQRDELVNRLSREQSSMMDNLVVKVRKLEAEVRANQKTLEQLRREKVDMENSLEHEQEALFNSLSKRVDQLEAEKRHLYSLLNPQSQEVGNPPPTPNDSVSGFAAPLINSGDTNDNTDIVNLRNQLARARSTILSLRQRVNEMERDKRDNHQKLAKLTVFAREPPTYEEFCQFLAELNKSHNSNSEDPSRMSPAHSESSISVPGSQKVGRSPLSISSRDVSMDSFADRYDGDGH